MTAPSPAPRIADYPIDPIHLTRWSPRAFDGSTITEEQLMTLFEAARWAPSSGNAQPWRFVYALRETPAWDRLFDLLLPMNRGWAQHASALFYVLSDTLIVPPGKTELVPSPTHSFDSGAAWAALAFEATRMGLYTHGIAGFDRARAIEMLDAGERFRVEAAITVGRIGDPATLPEMLRAREFPSSRRPLSESVFEGSMSQA